MKNLFPFLLAGVSIAILSISNATADTYECKTTVRPATGFTNGAAKWWFPTNTTHTIKGSTAQGYIFDDPLSGTVSSKGTRTYINYKLEGKEDYSLTYVF